MTEPGREEARLRALFDETASDADRVQLTRLRARALDIPSRRAKRSPWRLLGPALALAAGALIVVFAQRGGPRAVNPSQNAEARASAAGRDAALSPSRLSVASARPKAPAVRGSAGAENGEDGDSELEVPLAGAAFGDESDDLLGPLYASADDETDAWLIATGAFLEDG